MDKKFWAIIGVMVAVFVGIAVVSNNKNESGSAKTDAKPTNHVKGENAKKVTLVEYGDFECPVCAAHEPVVRQVFEKYQADIQFQFRHFPIISAHKNAFAGARAAEAASMQGKFWEMHDLLYDNQRTWSASDTPLTFFEQYAEALKLDKAKFKTDFASDTVQQTVNADLNAALELDVNATPTYYLNGKKIENSQVTDENNVPQLDKFSKLIDEAIAAADKQ